MNFSKDNIKKRMLHRMSILWDVEFGASVDPIVSLMIEALAEEVFMLSKDVDDMDNRLLSRFMYSMLPTQSIASRGAHSLIKVSPLSQCVQIKAGDRFAYKDTRTLRGYELNHLEFCSICDYEVYNTELRYIVIDNTLYKYYNNTKRSVVGTVNINNASSKSVVWIGLDSENINSIENIPLYFDFINVENKKDYLNLLDNLRITYGDTEIQFERGLSKKTSLLERMKNDNNPYSYYTHIYDIHYILLKNLTLINKQEVHSELMDLVQKMDNSDSIMWLKLEFPRTLPFNVLELLKVGVNYIPIANMIQKHKTQIMSDVSVFMPLNLGANEQYMCTTEVQDSLGKNYYMASLKDYNRDDPERGIYSIRMGGVERQIDRSDAKREALRLLEILKEKNLIATNREENEINYLLDEILSKTEEVNRLINLNDDKVVSRPYLIVDKSTKGELLIVDYYTTNGAVINNFFSSISLVLVDNVAKIDEHIELLYPFRGGKDIPSLDRVKDIHRYVLTSRERIFTSTDITNFCMAEYGDVIKHIEIKNGCAISYNESEGLIQTLDIYILLNDKILEMVNIEDFKCELLNKLELNSPNSYNYRIIIKE